MNPATVPKQELIARARYTCKHRHSGIDHPKCYEETHPAERIGFLDIEATSLNASFGYVLSYCIKPLGGVTLERPIAPKDIRARRYDKRLCEKLIEDLGQFDRIMGYYSSRYDVPFLRTRCLYWKIDFPPMGSIFHTDVYYAVRSKMKLYRNRLEAACDLLGIPSKGHRLNPQVWMGAAAGDQKSIDFVLKHNIEDVVALEALWLRLNPHMRLTKTSV